MKWIFRHFFLYRILSIAGNRCLSIAKIEGFDCGEKGEKTVIFLS
ncbi:MAG: hypothetical protein WB791_10625 [Waddliaceae bacterium]